MAHQKERERASPLPDDGEVIGVVGAPGNGKTTLLGRVLVREVRDHHRQALLFDPTRDLVKRITVSSAADPTERIPRQQITVVQSVAQAKEAMGGRWSLFTPVLKSRVVAFQPQTKSDLGELAKAWLDMVDSEDSRGIVWACDEAQLVWPNSPSRGSALNVATLTRNRQQIGLWTTQRPQNIFTTLRQNSTRVCVFGGDSRRYIDPGCAEFGDRTIFEPALGLPQFSYLYREPRRENPLAELPRYDARTDAIPWE